LRVSGVAVRACMKEIKRGKGMNVFLQFLQASGMVKRWKGRGKEKKKNAMRAVMKGSVSVIVLLCIYLAWLSSSLRSGSLIYPS
jgi:hypothetical protein